MCLYLSLNERAVAQELINKVKSKCCGIKANDKKEIARSFYGSALYY